MDRIEPIRPSLPPIDTTRVRRVIDERERHPDARQEPAQQRRRRGEQEDPQREWSTDQTFQDDEEQDDPPHIDVRA